MPDFVPTSTPVSEPFWAGAREGELRMQECLSCRRFYFYPRSFCPRCGGVHVEWRTLSGQGRVASYVIHHRREPDGSKATRVVALVEVDEGPRMMTNLVGVDEPIVIGMRVSVEFERRGPVVLPVFSPTRVAQ
jgi:uncharacterized OB-fold protein